MLQTQAPTEIGRALVLAARAEMWRCGDLRFKFHADQLRVDAQIRSAKASRFVLEIARKWGKTWYLACKAMEYCLKKPRSRVVYGAPTLKHLAEFVLPVMEELIQDAPVDCKPVFNVTSGHWTFPNGSYIHLFGADDKRKANRGRGPAAVAGFFDEAGFCPILGYVLRSIFKPSMLHTGGPIFLGSTPSEEPDHEFTAIAERAELNGTYARRTIWDNPLLTRPQIERFIEDDAKDEGMTVEEYQLSDDFRREYMAERVINKLLVVVPEWEAAAPTCRIAVPRPEYFDGMTVLDFGGHDPHAVLFGYWHFPLAKWVIEHELLMRKGENTAQLAEAIVAKEKEIWGTERHDGTFRGARELMENLPEWLMDAVDAEAPDQPYARWGDNNIALCTDLHQLHGLAVIPTAKDDKELQVNNLRVMVRAKQVLINPRCEHTHRHLLGTVWENHRRKTYRRKNGEHGDLLDCLVYGARNLNRSRNPFPDTNVGRGAYRAAKSQKMTEAQALAEAVYGSTVFGRRLLNGSGNG